MACALSDAATGPSFTKLKTKGNAEESITKLSLLQFNITLSYIKLSVQTNTVAKLHTGRTSYRPFYI